MADATEIFLDDDAEGTATPLLHPPPSHPPPPPPRRTKGGKLVGKGPPSRFSTSAFQSSTSAVRIPASSLTSPPVIQAMATVSPFSHRPPIPVSISPIVSSKPSAYRVSSYPLTSAPSSLIPAPRRPTAPLPLNADPPMGSNQYPPYIPAVSTSSLSASFSTYSRPKPLLPFQTAAKKKVAKKSTGNPTGKVMYLFRIDFIRILHLLVANFKCVLAYFEEGVSVCPYTSKPS